MTRTRRPELRPYRVAMYAAFFGVCVVLVGAIAGSIAFQLWASETLTAPVAGVGAGTAGGGDEGARTRARRACAGDLHRLYLEASGRLLTMGTTSDRHWRAWRADWAGRLDALTRQCGLFEPPSASDSPLGRNLKTVAARIPRLFDPVDGQKAAMADIERLFEAALGSL